MKNRIGVVGLVTIGVLFALSAFAKGNKYVQPGYAPSSTDDVAFAERTTSMSDCMTFSASHKTRGSAGDNAEFRRQFGTPLGSSGGVTEYSYDTYTKILIDCSKRSCSSRCLSK